MVKSIMLRQLHNLREKRTSHDGTVARLISREALTHCHLFYSLHTPCPFLTTLLVGRLIVESIWPWMRPPENLVTSDFRALQLMFLKKLLVFAALSCSLLVHVAFAAEDDLQSEHVKQAIHRARNFLLEKQDRVQGNWVSYPSFPGGKTALCTLALLNAGDAPQEPHISRAIAHLRSMSAPKHTYVAAF